MWSLERPHQKISTIGHETYITIMVDSANASQENQLTQK